MSNLWKLSVISGVSLPPGTPFTAYLGFMQSYTLRSGPVNELLPKDSPEKNRRFVSRGKSVVFY